MFQTVGGAACAGGLNFFARENKGRMRSCLIHPPAMRAIDQWVRDRRSMWETRLDRLARHMGENGGN